MRKAQLISGTGAAKGRQLAADTAAHRLHGNEGKQGQVPRAFDGSAERALVLGAHTALPAWFNLGPVGHIAAQPLVVLVVDVLDVFHAEGAHPPARRVASPGSTTGARPTCRARPPGLETAGTGSRSGSALSCGRGAGLACRGRGSGCCRCGCRCRHSCTVPPLFITRNCFACI